MTKAKDTIQWLFPLGTIIVLFLVALYRVIIEIDYAKGWGYDTYSGRMLEFGIFILIAGIPAIVMLLKFFQARSFGFKFTFASAQFLAAVVVVTAIFNGGTFSGNGDLRMIFLGIFVCIAFLLIVGLFVFQILLFKKNKNNHTDMGVLKQKLLSFDVLVPILIQFFLFTITMYFDCMQRAPLPNFFNSYGKFLLIFPVSLLITITIAIINIKSKKLALYIANYIIAFYASS